MRTHPGLAVGTAVSQGIAGNTPKQQPHHHQHPHQITENLTGIINTSFPLGSSTETARASRALSLNVSGCPNTLASARCRNVWALLADVTRNVPFPFAERSLFTVSLTLPTRPPQTLPASRFIPCSPVWMSLTGTHTHIHIHTHTRRCGTRNRVS